MVTEKALSNGSLPTQIYAVARSVLLRSSGAMSSQAEIRKENIANFSIFFSYNH